MTFYELQKQLAVMVGANLPETLPTVEHEQVKYTINQMYRFCYLPPEGRRPPWSRQSVTIHTEGRKTTTLNVIGDTRDFVDVSGRWIWSDKFIGATVKMDGRTYNLESLNVGENAGTFTDSIAKTGIFSAEVFQNALKLPDRTADVDAVVVAGNTKLEPYASENPLDLNLYQGNEPSHYYVDSTLIAGNPGPRLYILPAPINPVSISLRVNVSPALLVNDDDKPILPADAITDCLLPLARAKYAEISPRYNAKNLQSLRDDRNEAERKLRSFSSVQKGRTMKIKLKQGF
jgi:hypothetical protein